jgi:hypothetical protein
VNRVDLPGSAWGARPRQDRTVRGQNGGVLDERRIGMAGVGLEVGQREAAVLERIAVGGVL